MTAQLTLLSATPADVLAPVRGRVHRNDPPTSHAATAEGPRLAGQRAAVMVALAAAGARGLTGHEACALTPCLYPHVATTRIEELCRLGLAEPTDLTRATPSKKQATVWRATEAGALVAAGLR